MKYSLNARLKELEHNEILLFISGIRRGFEKECLRVDKEGSIALTRHPHLLGSSLTHPMITTDYSESLLEFVTPPTEDIRALFNTLNELHQFTYRILKDEAKDEYLWASSMPCRLVHELEIPIAHYGTSNIGQLKYIYRKGLGLRYSRTMQTIAGIHYNFSLSKNFWIAYHALKHSTDSLTSFISEQYLAMLRNALRFEWLLVLLYGASPSLCTSFHKAARHDLEPIGDHTLVGPYATSLRMSDLGYQNKSQMGNFISYNSLPEYLETMHHAVHTVEPEFARLGVKVDGEYRQLSACRLQIEDEHYASMRPKRLTPPDVRMLGAIARDGIEYIEVRSLDINPFLKCGIETETVHILDAFLLMCLFLDSPSIEKEEDTRIRFNHSQVVNLGRKYGTMLRKENDEQIMVQDYSNEILAAMEKTAHLLDRAYGSHDYSLAVRRAAEKVSNMEKLPSARVVTEIKQAKDSYFSFGNHWSRIHEAEFKEDPLDEERLKYYNELAADSLHAQMELEQHKGISFDEFLERYLVF